jgi:hypothetical protein
LVDFIGGTVSFGGSRSSAGLSRIKINEIIQEIHLAKPNYRHAKKQKEAARKARQDAKQVRRSTVPDAADVADVPVEPLPIKPVA